MLNKHTFPRGIAILVLIAILGFIPVIFRFIYGLGAVSNLSDGRPWGFWISFDLYCGVALASGGFTMAAWVYIFHRENYSTLARPAILMAFLGYTLVILALLVDLGQPWYIWHALIYWNIHSPLFEVALCVMTYIVVLALELSPAIFEALERSKLPLVRKFQWHILLKVIRKIQIPLIIVGVCISTLHQSSLGTMLLLFPYTLHPLWYTPILPVLFLISAIAVGPAIVIFESTLTGKAFGHKLATSILSRLGQGTAFILALYLLLKILDLIFRGKTGLVFSASPQNLLWWFEIVIGVIFPLILFSIPGVRKNRQGVFWTACLVISGLIVNRFNVSMLALDMRPGFSYFPNWMEIAISAGLIADALLVVWLAYRLLPIQQKTTVSVDDVPAL